MRTLALYLCAIPMFSAITNVVVVGVTPTQAKITYTAPDSGVCSWEVSESNTYSPLVHDVDTSLFAGANLDSRAGAVSRGRERMFIVGTRGRAFQASNLHYYSRALQLLTTHYYRITCGSDTATGSFTTANIALGNTNNEDLPSAPTPGQSGWFVGSGEYAWPEFIDWNKATGRPETVIDPQTGMILKRITMPQDQVTGNNPSGDHSFTSVDNPTSGWTNPNNVLVDDGNSATFSGTGRDWLLLHDSDLGFDVYYLESIVAGLKAWCTGACAGDDAKIQVGLSVDGVGPWPDANNLIDVTLGTTANPSTFSTAGTTGAVMASWTPAGRFPLTTTDAHPYSGLVDVDASGNVTYTGGTFDAFYPNWKNGSKITIGSSVCTITGLTDTKLLSVNPAACSPALSVPVTGASYHASNFAVMIRKKTTSTDTISIQYAKYTLTESIIPGWTSSGSPQICSNTLVQNSNGDQGYVCKFDNMVYFIDHTTADAAFLGMYTFPSQAGADGWDGNGCLNASNTIHGTTPTAPLFFYCPTSDHSGHSIMLKCTLVSSYTTGDFFPTCVNETLGSAGKDMQSLITAFAAGQTPAYDPTTYGPGGVSAMQNGQLIMAASRGQQDSIAWIIIFDPEKIDTAAGCVGGGNPGCVIAMQNTWSTYPVRFCGLHTLFAAGDSNTAWLLGKYMAESGNPGAGPHSVTITSGSFTSTPTIAAGTSGCPGGSKGCDLVTVDGEPCNMSPAGSVGGHPAEPLNCPKNAAWYYLQDAAVGDVFTVQGTSGGENTRLTSKSGNSWLFERGYGYSTPQTPSTPVLLQEACQSRPWNYGAFATDWLWDFEHDPHALNTSGTVVIGPGYSHPAPKANVTVSTIPQVDSTHYGYGITDGPGYIPATKFSSLGPGFAGTVGISPFNESAQDHPSHPQDTAVSSEQKWFFDARPLSGPGATLIDQATKVSGQLYKFVSTTTDGDNLTQIGGSRAFLGGMNRKQQPTMARCGTQPLIDVSSATLGNTIATDNTDAYHYCVARKAGECRVGSAQGDVYANCPYSALRPTSPDVPVSSYGCDVHRYEIPLSTEICLNNTGSFLNQVVQFGFGETHSDPVGALTRGLTKHMLRVNIADGNENAHALPDASWALMEANGIWGEPLTVVAGKLPPYPAVDNMNRTTFVRTMLSVAPPGGLSGDNAIVEFGYAENGPETSFYCTSRKEPCIANASTITDATPFQFPSDGSGGTLATVTGVSCASSCTIAIPALSQRVMYYQVLYRDAANHVVAQSTLQTAVTP